MFGSSRHQFKMAKKSRAKFQKITRLVCRILQFFRLFYISVCNYRVQSWPHICPAGEMPGPLGVTMAEQAGQTRQTFHHNWPATSTTWASTQTPSRSLACLVSENLFLQDLRGEDPKGDRPTTAIQQLTILVRAVRFRDLILGLAQISNDSSLLIPVSGHLAVQEPVLLRRGQVLYLL